MKKYKWEMLVYGIFSLITYVFFTTIYWSYQWITNAAVSKNLNEAKIITLKVFLLLVGLFIFFYLGLFIERALLSKIIGSTRNKIMEKIMNLNYSKFHDIDGESYASMMINDLDILETDYYSSLINIIGEVSRVLISCVFIAMINVRYIFIILLLSIPSLLQPYILMKKVKEAGLKNSQVLETYNSVTNEYINGMEEIILNNNQYEFNNKFKLQAEKLENTRFDSKKLNAMDSLISMIFFFFVDLLGPIIFVLDTLKGILNPSSVASLVGFSNNVANPISTVITLYKKMNSSKLIKEKVEKFINEETRENITKVNIEDIEKIQIQNLTFSYGEIKTLDDVSLNFEKGKKYAIFGKSGCGKSTLLKIMMGFLGEYGGNVYINGIDKKQIEDKNFWDKIAYLPQSGFTIEGSIKDNITMFEKNVDENKLKESINISGLSNIISHIKNGIDGEISQGGKNFSGGEKQRISLARALYSRRNVLILDESFSALDNESLLEVEKGLLELDKTIISISHRINDNLDLYDEIIIFEKGKILERGTFKELMNDGIYFQSILNDKEEVKNDK